MNFKYSDAHISRRYQPLASVIERVRLNREFALVEIQVTDSVAPRHKAYRVEGDFEFW